MQIFNQTKNGGSPLAGVQISAVKRSIGFTIGFHNHGEGP